jgi:hypothetical protein
MAIGSLKKVKAHFPNTGGSRAKMKTGSAPHPTPKSKVHDSGYTYAPFSTTKADVMDHNKKSRSNTK